MITSQEDEKEHNELLMKLWSLMEEISKQEYFVELCELISKNRKVNPRTQIIVRFSVEGIHRWKNCPLDEVSYLRDYHRHIFNVVGKAYVSHMDRDIEFIQLSHQMKQYLTNKYFSTEYNCCFFDDNSCEMLANELAIKFGLYEVEVNEDGESGSIVKNLG